MLKLSKYVFSNPISLITRENSFKSYQLHRQKIKLYHSQVKGKWKIIRIKDFWLAGERISSLELEQWDRTKKYSNIKFAINSWGNEHQSQFSIEVYWKVRKQCQEHGAVILDRNTEKPKKTWRLEEIFKLQRKRTNRD